jgi:23S rRNA (adenine-C8)-methyltransferase
MCIQLFPNPPPRTRYAAIAELLESLGEPAYRLSQLVRAVHRTGTTEYAQLSALPRRVRSSLIEAFGPTFADLRPIARQSGDQVEKTLFENDNGARIETVLARYRTGWTSLCLSTQVGCGLGCTFCATGAVGLVRNLTADEICDQVLYHQRQGPVDSIAFMGMGEALANPHTFPALDVLTHKDYFGLSPRRITVSTVGFAPGLQRLVDNHPQVNVTLSVHSPFAEERERLISSSVARWTRPAGSCTRATCPRHPRRRQIGVDSPVPLGNYHRLSRRSRMFTALSLWSSGRR